MLVYQITTELTGGTGIAAVELNKAINNYGVSSKLFFKGTPNLLKRWRKNTISRLIYKIGDRIQIGIEHRRWSHNGFVTGVHWWPGITLDDFENTPNVINLHQTFRWIDLDKLFTSIGKKIPIVWSLHDLIPLTGGCQHPVYCKNYLTHCGTCPQLKGNREKDFSYYNFKLKKNLYNKVNIHFIGNSLWTTRMAEKSALSKYARTIRTIELGLDTSEYYPLDKKMARQALGIEEDACIIGFGASNVSSTLKGLPILNSALKQIKLNKKLKLLVFGNGNLRDVGSFEKKEIDKRNEDYDVIHFGYIYSSRVKRLYYSALDAFIVPSIVESFCLTALESMACGRPVVAFKTGGLQNLIIDMECGLLVNNVGDPVELSEKISYVLDNIDVANGLGINARTRVEKQYDIKITAQKYVEAYQEILSKTK